MKPELKQEAKHFESFLEKAHLYNLSYENFEAILKGVIKRVYPQNIPLRKQLTSFLNTIKPFALSVYQVELYMNPSSKRKAADYFNKSNIRTYKRYFLLGMSSSSNNTLTFGSNSSSNNSSNSNPSKPPSSTLDEMHQLQHSKNESENRGRSKIKKNPLIREVMKVHSVSVRKQNNGPSITSAKRNDTLSTEPRPKPPKFPPLVQEQAFLRKGAKLYETNSGGVRGKSEVGYYSEHGNEYTTTNFTRNSLMNGNLSQSYNRPLYSSQDVYSKGCDSSKRGIRGDCIKLDVDFVTNSYSPAAVTLSTDASPFSQPGRGGGVRIRKKLITEKVLFL